MTINRTARRAHAAVVADAAWEDARLTRESFQTIAALICRDPDYLAAAQHVLQAAYFSPNKEYVWLVDKALEHWQTYGEPITEAVVEHELASEVSRLRRETVRDADADLVEAIRDLWCELAQVDIANRQYWLEKTEAWCQQVAVEQALLDAQAANIDGDRDHARKVLDKAFAVRLRPPAIGVNMNEDWRRMLLADAAASDPDQSIPIMARKPDGSPSTVDWILRGGIRRGELAVVQANIGRGKSIWLGQVAINALLGGFNVMMYTAELGAEPFAVRLLANLARRPMDEIHDAYRNLLEKRSPHHAEAKQIDLDLTELMATIGLGGEAADRHWQLVEVPAEAYTVAQIGVDIDKHREAGRQVDLLIFDYADLLHHGSSGSDERLYERLLTVFNQLRGLATGHDVAVWTATQANRGGEGKRTLGLDDTGDSYAKARPADFVCSLSPVPAEAGPDAPTRYYLKLNKTRRSEGTDRVILLDADFERATFTEAEDDLTDPDHADTEPEE